MKRALLVGSLTYGLSGVLRDIAVVDEVLVGLGFTTVRAPNLTAELGASRVAAALTTLTRLAVAAPAAALVADSAAAVAVLVHTSARALEKASGTSVGVYRTSLLPHRRFGAGTGTGRHPAGGLVRARGVSFAVEVTDLDSDGVAGSGAAA